MMTNLFSIFDPSTDTYINITMNLSWSFPMNWFSILIMFIFMPYQFWLIPSRYTITWNFIFKFLFNELKILINYSFSNLLFFISLFTMIMTNNFLGLFPYIFTASSHLSFCFTLSLSMWLSMMIFGWTNYLNSMFCHLTPQGTPSILMPFMVLIESISLIIRPLTLSVRLTANMIAGHLLLTLIGSSNLFFNLYLFPFMLMTQTLLMTLEIAVSMIQAYVFSILLTLYSSEI